MTEVIDFLRQQEPRHIQRVILERRSQIDYTLQEISGFESRIADLMRQVQEYQRLLDAELSAAGNNDYAEHLVAEWQQLENHPRLASASANSNYLKLITTPDLRLTRSDNGESRWLGSFEISIRIQTGNTVIRNLSTPRGGRDHPHVVDGSPCFGGHAESFRQILMRGDLYTYFELMVQYIETLNLADEYGRYGSYWFDVSDYELGAPQEHCLDGSWPTDVIAAQEAVAAQLRDERIAAAAESVQVEMDEQPRDERGRYVTVGMTMEEAPF